MSAWNFDRACSCSARMDLGATSEWMAPTVLEMFDAHHHGEDHEPVEVPEEQT
jgi:hypothetical protein